MAPGGSPVDRDSSCRSRVLSRLFRRLFLESVQTAFDTGQLRFCGSLQALAEPSGFAAHLQPTRHTQWVVYAKRPFAGPQHKDYRADPSQIQKTMTLGATEFIRRFLLHVLPAGFHRIRDYGWLSHRHRTTLARCRQLLGTPAAPRITGEPRPLSDYRDRYESLTGVSLRTCPACPDGHMIVTQCVTRARPYPALADTS
jgi:hypothetical protein